MDKGYWIFPSNAEYEFDAIAYFKNNEKVDWRRNNKNKSAKKGDIVFIYVSKIQTEKYKSTLAIQTEVIEITNDKIWLKFNGFFKSPIPYAELKQYAGVKSNLQGAEPIKERYVDFILNYPESLKTAQQEASKDFLQDKRVWLYKPGEQGSKWGRMLELGLMGIGWSKLGDLSHYTREQIKPKLDEFYPLDEDGSRKNDVTTLYNFANKIKIGDMVLAMKGTTKILGYGEVTSDYFYDTNKDTDTIDKFCSFREVKWTKKELVLKERWAIKTLTDITNYKETQDILDLLDIKSVKKIQNNDIPLNQILYGPPGTGKTYGTIDKALEILCERGEIDSIPQERDEKKKKFDEFMEQGQIGFVTFHQSYGYEDFVEGIRPRLSGENDESQVSEKMEYEIKDGIFKRMCQNASINYEKPYILIIDEINRGNISKILGELITLLEPSKRKGESEALEVTLPYSQEPFSVPNNLYIIGTMNTADRSIALLDTALRRRFEFIEMLPNPKELEKISCDDAEIDLKELLKAMNNRIEFLLDRERTIGHSFFFEKAVNKGNDSYELTLTDLKAVFKNKILPLLQEYFYDDYAKINAVLNDNGMLESKTMRDMEISLSDDFVDTDKRVWKITDSSQWKRWNFQKIYDNNAKKNPSPDNTESSMDSSANIANDSNAESNQNL